MIDRRRALLGAGNLPNGYKKVGFLQSSGSQYIVTDVVADNNSRFLVDFEAVSYGGRIFVGARYASGEKAFTLGFGSTVQIVSGYGNTPNRNIIPFDTDRHLIDKNKNKIYLDGALNRTDTPQSFTCPGTVNVFACYQNSGGNGSLRASVKMYSLKIFNNDLKVIDFVPCIRTSDGEPGMYDLCGTICDLTGTPFYINYGTGEFGYETLDGIYVPPT